MKRLALLILAGFWLSASADSIGPQTVFVALLSYPDRVCSFTRDQAIQSLNTMAVNFAQYSYGKTSLTSTVSATFMMMPHTGDYYDGSRARQLISQDAGALALANGYGDILNDYNHVIYMVPNTEGIGSNGWTSGKETWMDNTIDSGLLTHEMGHGYGLRHAHRWVPCDLNNPVDTCGQLIEYGDCFDRMGHGSYGFNPYEQNFLGWLLPTQINTVTANGTFKIHRFDDPLAGTFRHLAVVVIVPGTSRTYWLAYRYTPTSTRLGVILMRADPNYSSTLIDFHSITSSCSDVTIPVGATLVDQGFRVTPIGLGGTAPNFWIQVQIEFT